MFIDAKRAIYELEFRQQDLARELENHRRVKAALQAQNRPSRQLWSRIRYGWHVLSRIRKIDVAISVDLNEPCPDVAS